MARLSEAPARRRASRLVTVLLLGLGGAIAAAGAAGPWVRLSADDGLSVVQAEATGSALAPLTSAAGLVALAAAPAVLVVSGIVRRVVAGLVLVLAVGALASSVLVLTDSSGRARRWWSVEVGGLAEQADASLTAWPAVVVLGLACAATGAGIVLARGAGWPGLSSRYDAPGGSGRPATSRRPGTSGPPSDVDMWQALDRGDDPTATEADR